MYKADSIDVGSSFTLQKKVEKKDTANYFGSRNLDNLLATPSLVALMVEASAKLIDKKLPEELVSVGARLQLSHDNPTTLGEIVTIKAVVKEVKGRIVKIEIIAYDEVGTIGTAIHDRVIMNKDTLFERVKNRNKVLDCRAH